MRRTTHRRRARPRDHDLAIDANSGAQKIQENYCTICCTIPASGGRLAGSLAFLRLNGNNVSADRQWDSLRIPAEFAQVADQKTVALRSRRFTQVLILRILGVCGEVAEWPKAAVC